MNFKNVLDKYGYPIISKEVSQYIYEAKTTRSQKLLNIRLNGKKGGKQGKIPEKYKFLLEAPFKISHVCCKIMKKNPAKDYEKKSGKKPFVGTLACESSLRKSAWIKHGCNAFNAKRPISQPLSFWREQDILQYISENKIEIASVYGKVILEKEEYRTTKEQRTGCMFCGFGAHLEEENRFQKIKQTHPLIYNFIMKPRNEGGLGFKEVLTFCKIKF